MKFKIILFYIIASVTLFAQIESASLVFKRGKLWQTIEYGKTGPNFSNWTDRGIGLDWPGFDPTFINENIGGSPSYMVSGGMYVGCMAGDSVLSVEEWALYGGSVKTGAAAKYEVKTHRHKYNAGDNHWLQVSPNAGEEVIETVWEYNTNYDDEFQIRRMLPVRVRRTAHQWSGSKLDENYIIYEYVIKNIADEIKANVTDNRFVADSLKDFYIMLTYGMHANSRAWAVNFPSYSPGARNTKFLFDSKRKTIWGRAYDFDETTGINESFGKSLSQGLIADGKPQGEYLAPAYCGFSLLYTSENKDGNETDIQKYGWSAASNSIDLSGPFTNIGSKEAQYNVLKDLTLASNFIDSPFDTVFMGKSRMWSLMQLGPWDINPGDSVVVVLAEIVDGAEYADALSPATVAPNALNSRIRNKFNASVDRAIFTHENKMNHPDPPAAPVFKVDYNRESQDVAIIVEWGTEAENISDPDDGTFDLDGYIIYRSGYLPIGPWEPVDTIYAGDINFMDGGKYKYYDYGVDIGQSYYYALTSFDTPKANWSGVDQVTNIPSMESSIFANRLIQPFVANLPAAENTDEILVVPNPFVIGEGFSSPGIDDNIQFVNLPNPCTVRIYTVRGDLVKTIKVERGDGAIVSWDQVTNYGQFVESGVYIYHVEHAGSSKIGKFAIVR